jgi:catalase
MQIMPSEDAANYRFNPFDMTKVWPHGEYPLIEVGELELNRNPVNYFAEVEQSAFNPVNIVPGMGYSPDKMLQARLVSYPDAHRYRIGVNYESLPVNRPRCPVHTYHRDGAMRFDDNGGSGVNYEPNSEGGPKEDAAYRDRALALSGEPAARYDHREGNDDYSQVGNFWKILKQDERQRLAENIAGSLGQTPRHIQERQLQHFYKAHKDYGALVERELKKVANQHPEAAHEPELAEAGVRDRKPEK